MPRKSGRKWDERMHGSVLRLPVLVVLRLMVWHRRFGDPESESKTGETKKEEVRGAKEAAGCGERQDRNCAQPALTLSSQGSLTLADAAACAQHVIQRLEKETAKEGGYSIACRFPPLHVRDTRERRERTPDSEARDERLDSATRVSSVVVVDFFAGSLLIL